MNRRTWLLGTGSVLTAGALGVGGFIVTGPGAQTLEEARASLLALDVEHVQLEGDWSTSQIMIHLARSIEYSMQGFPQPKPAWFQATLGRAASRAFSARGQMIHGLDTRIDGAPELPLDVPVIAARARVIQAIDDFLSFKRPLHPHFAYGALAFDDFATAHALHIENHLR